MYGIHEGNAFEVHARRESASDNRLVIRFECKEGMGILGIRKIDRTDPGPSTVYQEGEIDPESLRAGRFVHVLSNGQRQSYALSRLTPDTAARLPADAWVELQPHSEYGFRYLVAPEDKLLAPREPSAPAANVAAVAAAVVAAPVTPSAPPASAPAAAPLGALRPPAAVPAATAAGDVPAPVPMAPALAHAALARLDRDAAVRHLTEEMAKVATLQQEVQRLEEELQRSASRERDLIALLTRWRER